MCPGRWRRRRGTSSPAALSGGRFCVGPPRSRTPEAHARRFVADLLGIRAKAERYRLCTVQVPVDNNAHHVRLVHCNRMSVGLAGCWVARIARRPDAHPQNRQARTARAWWASICGAQRVRGSLEGPGGPIRRERGIRPADGLHRGLRAHGQRSTEPSCSSHPGGTGRARATLGLGCSASERERAARSRSPHATERPCAGRIAARKPAGVDRCQRTGRHRSLRPTERTTAARAAASCSAPPSRAGLSSTDPVPQGQVPAVSGVVVQSAYSCVSFRTRA
jgi:hypothetical protein